VGAFDAERPFGLFLGHLEGGKKIREAQPQSANTRGTNWKTYAQ